MKNKTSRKLDLKKMKISDLQLRKVNGGCQHGNSSVATNKSRGQHICILTTGGKTGGPGKPGKEGGDGAP